MTGQSRFNIGDLVSFHSISPLAANFLFVIIKVIEHHTRANSSYLYVVHDG